MISCNFWTFSFVLRSFVIDWSKTFCLSIVTLYSFTSTFGIKYPVWLVRCALSSNDKTKTLFTPWKLESIKKYKYWFWLSNDTFDWYLFQLIVLLKPDFNCWNSFSSILSWQGYNCNIKFCFCYCIFRCPSRRRNNTDQARITLIWQLIKGISRVLQKRLKYLYNSFLYF